MENGCESYDRLPAIYSVYNQSNWTVLRRMCVLFVFKNRTFYLSTSYDQNLLPYNAIVNDAIRSSTPVECNNSTGNNQRQTARKNSDVLSIILRVQRERKKFLCSWLDMLYILCLIVSEVICYCRLLLVFMLCVTSWFLCAFLQIFLSLICPPLYLYAYLHFACVFVCLSCSVNSGLSLQLHRLWSWNLFDLKNLVIHGHLSIQAFIMIYYIYGLCWMHFEKDFFDWRFEQSIGFTGRCIMEYFLVDFRTYTIE